MKKILLFLMLITGFSALGMDLIVIDRDSKVYDTPSVKGYATTNRSGVEVRLSRGMVFPKSSSDGGWDMIEYTPGLKGYILASQEIHPRLLKEPKAGKYMIANNKSKSVEITGSGLAWVISTPDGKSIAGTRIDNILVFKNEFGNIAYSLVSLPSGPVVMDYDNRLTDFF